jgi:hypothetical protein
MTGWKIAGALCLAALGACAQEPDFAAPRPGLVQRIDAAFNSATVNVPSLPMTGAERDLRSIAANLADGRPAPERDRTFALPAWIDAPAPAASSGYYDRLRARRPATAVTLVDMIAADADADTAVMERFVTVAHVVVEDDGARLREMQAAPAGAADVCDRVGENGRIIDETGNILAARLADYRAALLHVRIDAPEAERLDVLEAAIDRMGDQLALMDRNALAHTVVVSDLKATGAKS